jgi:hypothetical protein
MRPRWSGLREPGSDGLLEPFVSIAVAMNWRAVVLISDVEPVHGPAFTGNFSQSSA